MQPRKQRRADLLGVLSQNMNDNRLSLSRGFIRLILYLAVALFTIIFLSNSLRGNASSQSRLSYGISTQSRGNDGSSIGKISSLTGAAANSTTYQRSMALHERHNARFGYPMFTLGEEILPNSWNKPLWLLSVLTQELAKPVDERLQWLAWIDSDVTLMNPNIPLEAFLPPRKAWSHINLVCTNDHNGLSNGVFFLRVHPWAVDLFTTILSIKKYEPGLDLEFEEQTAMELWILSDAYRKNVMHVPQRWFNADVGEWNGILARSGKPETIDPPKKYKKRNTFHQGDLLVHHTVRHKKTKQEHMARWLEVAESQQSDWEPELKTTGLDKEIKQFWETEAKNEELRADKMVDEMESRRDRRSKDE
ncbi:galactosyl transferase-like protein 2 [Elsinoe australis]|uniref:Galactosyl transferase-like protein 2 n=1 Tax=Elsinoe australis TaxID=40998 RepID=A0A4U7AWW3_9PEZI|nr:galactosyl transferase-like protein 2 [Elsinoe australis]